ncbi:MAG: hypothetical protein K2X77_25195 [Candidatus Obscuribacterales bacterium]|nr:hypothetical protein [Candidatus Obscuribacterales bacterium]
MPLIKKLFCLFLQSTAIHSHKALTVLALLCLFLLSSTAVQAYYDDTHYGLTYHLARCVGYTPEQAYRIASAAVSVDYDPQTEPEQYGNVFMPYTPKGSAQNPRIDFHAMMDEMRFPQCMTDPSQELRAKDAIKVQEGVLWRRAKGNLNLGAFLHFLQDETSHAGYGSFGGHWASATAARKGLPIGPYCDYLSSEKMEKHLPMIWETISRMTLFMKELCPKQRVNQFGYMNEVEPVVKEMIRVNPISKPALVLPLGISNDWNDQSAGFGKWLKSVLPIKRDPDYVKSHSVIEQASRRRGDTTTYRSKPRIYNLDANGDPEPSEVNDWVLWGNLEVTIDKPVELTDIKVVVKAFPTTGGESEYELYNDTYKDRPIVFKSVPVGDVIVEARTQDGQVLREYPVIKGVDNKVAFIFPKIKKAKPQLKMIKEELSRQTGQPGDEFRLRLIYELKGLTEAEFVNVIENATVTGPDGLIHSRPIKMTATNDTITCELIGPNQKPGVYEFSYDIMSGNWGNLRKDGFKYTVEQPLHPKKIELVDHIIEPAGANLFKLKVHYKLVGLNPGDTQTATESSFVSGPESYYPPPSTRSFSDGRTVLKEFSARADKVGTYNWKYSIDAGDYGRLEDTLSFQVEAKNTKAIQLVSASVEPKSAFVGDGFHLTVLYKVSGLNAGEAVEVNENDYVSFSKTFTNPTTHARASGESPLLRKTAAFTATQSGKHTWNFVIDAPGFQTLYGAVGFDVAEKEAAQKLRARLQYPMITLAPGETKNCTIYISGQKNDTQDRVEIVYPEISDNWGTLPGQVQVFPGTTSMDPWSMRGAGDYTKEYAAGQGYRAKVTAPPGVTPVKIIVKQKDVGQVTLTLFVKIVKKGDSTIGTEIENPRLPGTYIPKARRPGSENPLSGPGEVETDRGTVGPDGVTRTPDGNQNGPGSTQPGDRASNNNNNNNNQDQSNPDSTNNSNNGPVTWTGPRGVSIPSAPTSNTGPNPGTTKGQSNQTYVFSRAIFEKKIESGNLGISATSTSGGVSQGTVTTGRVARVPISTTYKNSMSYEAPITEIVSGDVSVTFPHDFVLVSNQARISASATANASIERTGEQRLHEDEPEKYTHDITISVGSSSPNTLTVASKPFMRNGRTNLNGGWEIPLSFSGQNGAKELSATIGNGYVKIGDGAYLHLKNVYYVLQGTEDKSKKGDSTEEAKDDKNTSPDEEKELTAWLENPSITLVAGRLPSTSSHIKIKGWKRDVSSPVEVIFPGQTFGNNLPDDLIVNPGGGSQDPSALSAISSDEGVYTWTQGFEAKIQAKPGVYQVPIIVRQAGAGQIQLVLNVTVEKNKNLRQGVINDGQTQALLNKSQPWNVPPEKKDESKPGWNLPQPHTAPSSSWNVPSTPHAQPAPGWNVPSTPRAQPAPGWNVPSTPRAQPAPGWNVPSTPPAQTAPGWNVPTTTTSKPGWNVPTTTHTQPSPGWNVPTTTHAQPSPGWNVPTTTHAQPSPGWNVPTTTHAQPSPGWNVPATPTAPPPPPPPPPPKPQVWNPPSTTPTTSPGWNVPTTTAPPRPTTQVQVTENYEGIYQREDDPTFKLRIYRDGGGLGAEWIQHPFATGKQVFGNAQRVARQATLPGRRHVTLP